MTVFQYLLPFAEIVLGLSLSYVAMNLHYLLNSPTRVRWDVLPLLAALFSLQQTIIRCWNWHDANTVTTGFSFGVFACVIGSTMMLFLMTAASLPERSDHLADLSQHFPMVRRRYWLLFAGQWASFHLVYLWVAADAGDMRDVSGWSSWLVLPISLLLSILAGRWIQICGLTHLILSYSWLYCGTVIR